MDAVFRALADPTRRSLLDELFREDGQTLSALEGRFSMTRIGVMKHLKVLEDAGLVVTKRRGREKLHFLNPVPIRLVHDRWVSKYTEPWAAGLVGLKTELERHHGEGLRDLHPHHARSGCGRRSPTPRSAASTTFGAAVESDWQPGSRLEMGAPGAGGPLGEGEVLEVDPPRRLVHTMAPLWSDEVKSRGHLARDLGDRAGRRDSCCLTVTHDQLREGANDQLYGGWPMILSGLKTWLETGELLTTPGSLMYVD